MRKDRAMSPRRLLIAVCLVWGGVVLAADHTGNAAAPPPPAGWELGGDAGRGQTVFAKHCALCHGVTGDGKSKMAATLNPKPADLTAKAVIDRRSDWELYLVVRDGGPAIGLSKTMFAWQGLLPDQQIRDAAAFIRSLGR
jgi:mono/diheme cytochrome c family protein